MVRIFGGIAIAIASSFVVECRVTYIIYIVLLVFHCLAMLSARRDFGRRVWLTSCFISICSLLRIEVLSHHGRRDFTCIVILERLFELQPDLLVLRDQLFLPRHHLATLRSLFL